MSKSPPPQDLPVVIEIGRERANDSESHTLSHLKESPTSADNNDTNISSHSLNPADPFKLERFIMSEEDMKAKKLSKGVRKFYTDQNELIESFLADLYDQDDRHETEIFEYKVAMYGSLFANILLFGLQLTAAIISKSLTLFATTLDAFMDLASSLVLLFTGKLAASHNYVLYPTGKSKYRTAGILVFATLMSTLALQIFNESIQSLASGYRDVDTDKLAIVMVASGIGLKVLLWLYCRMFPNLPSVVILAQDHQNDIMFNSTGLVLSFLATKYLWWIDPVGAMLIAGLIIRSWGSTAIENIRYIVGVSADNAFINRITYISMTHDPRILKIDTARAYYSGDTIFVEVDIVLPPTMSLAEAHDIGEALQTKLEVLNEVDRAFVHLDYEYEHKPEHKASVALHKRRSTRETERE